MGKKRWKDRKDGYYLYDADPMHKLMPFLYPKRTEAEVFLRETVDVTKVLEYIEECKKTEGNSVTLFSLLLAAIVRVFAMRPCLNNFIAGNRLYRRKRIDIGFVMKKEFTDEGAETVVKITFEPSATVTEVSERLYALVNEFRSSGSAGADGTIRTLTRMPRFLTKFVISFLKFMNYYGKVPKGLAETDPSFASAFVANIGSIGGNAPFHHLNNWGTNSLFITIGSVDDMPFLIGGSIEIRKCIDIAFTVDERIADGYYFIKSIKVMKDILSNPEILETPFVQEELNE